MISYVGTGQICTKTLSYKDSFAQEVTFAQREKFAKRIVFSQKLK